MLAQHTDESFRADHVRFRTAGGAVVQVLMRSDFFATEAFFCVTMVATCVYRELRPY